MYKGESGGTSCSLAPEVEKLRRTGDALRLKEPMQGRPRGSDIGDESPKG